jgi:hypothetical protein
MNKVILFVIIVMLCMFGLASAQTFSDYVSSMRGDTAVIKDYAEKTNTASTLSLALNSDTVSVPAGRVYMLKANGYYPLASNPTTSATRTIVIVGADNTRLVNNTNALSAPPLITGFPNSGGTNTGGINYGGNLTIKNCNMIPAASDGSLGWVFVSSASSNSRVVLENDLFEITRWVQVQSNANAGTKLYITDCYFANLNGQACRRNGGVYDNVNNNTDTMWVENTTHVVAQGSMYKFRNFQIKKCFFNHNTFIDCAGSIFESLGYESDLTVTNNIFVNSNVQAFCDSLGVWDAGETDADMLPTGIINCDTLPSTYTQMDRKILVDNNVVYWDPKFNDMVSTLNTAKVNGSAKWVSQMVTMNTRTQALFNDNAHYPYLYEGTWYKKLPTFTKPLDLLTAEVDTLKAFALSTVDNASTKVLGNWRKVNPPTGQTFIYSDWPIPVNLAYSDADLMAGGTGGFPVGDLNWFPTRKTAWAAQAAAEHTALQTKLNTPITGVKTVSNVPAEFALSQNYPNPFNPSTTITFSLPHSTNVSLKVFDMLGREIATLVNGFTTSGTHEVQFNAANVASGVYFYKLTSGDFTQMKKMTLVK